MPRPSDATEPDAPADPRADRPGSAADAFAEEVAPLLPLLTRAALRLTRDEHVADDLLQDTLERGFVHYGRYCRGTNLYGWLLRIMKNLRVSAFRTAARRPPTASLDSWAGLSRDPAARFESAALGDVEATVVSRLGEEAILRAVESLPEEFRSAIRLADVDGLPYRQAAAILGVPVGTVCSRLHRGRQQLQQALWHEALEIGGRTVAARREPASGAA